MNEIVELPPFVPGGSTAGAGRAAAAPAPASRTIRLSRAVPPVPPAQAEPVAAPADAIMADASAPAGLAGDAAPEAPAPAAAPSPAEPIPPEMLESLSAKTAEAAEAAPVVIMNLPEADEAPQLIARPRGYDVAERVQSLTTLAGMQMAEGEFGDAGKTIALLETYDAAAAGALARTLGHLERAAREKAEAERLEKEAAAEKARLEREREKAAREQEETARREREREEAAREQEAAAREKEQAAREREAEEPISVPPAFAAPAVPAVPPVDPDPLPAPAPAAVEGTAAAGSASLPTYARYLETVEPPEDPPLTAVMVPRASMAYGYAGDALSSAPPQVDPVAPYHVVRAPATPVFSPLVFPEAGEPLAAAGESVPVAAAEIPEGDVFVEAAEEGAAASVADVAQEAVVEGEGARPEASARRAPRESVIVGVPVGAGGVAGTGESVVLVAPPVAVYVPVVPAAPPSPARVYAAPSRTETRRNRPFTTDPYFRDY